MADILIARIVVSIDAAKSPSFGEISCGSLLQKLQLIWDEVGESDEERDRMLLQLEHDCLDVYKRKVDQATKSRALLLQELADSKYKLTRLLSALGEKTYIGIVRKSPYSAAALLSGDAEPMHLLGGIFGE